jgi:putative oxidoreductase
LITALPAAVAPSLPAAFEYKLPLLPPELAAVMATVGEHALPLLVLLGLGTRFAAFGLR